MNKRLSRDILKAEPETLIKLHQHGKLHTDAVRSIENALDLEEQRLQNHNRQKTNKNEKPAEENSLSDPFMCNNMVTTKKLVVSRYKRRKIKWRKIVCTLKK